MFEWIPFYYHASFVNFVRHWSPEENGGGVRAAHACVKWCETEHAQQSYSLSSIIMTVTAARWKLLQNMNWLHKALTIHRKHIQCYNVSHSDRSGDDSESEWGCGGKVREEIKQVRGKDLSFRRLRPELRTRASTLTTPCHRTRPSKDLVLISISMVSGESGALRRKTFSLLVNHENNSKL